GDPRIVPTATGQIDHQAAHGLDAVLAAGAIVPDSRRDAILSAAPVGVNLDDGKVSVEAASHVRAFGPDALPVEAVHHFPPVALLEGDDGLRVAVSSDGRAQKLHLRRRYGVWVIVVRLDLFGRHPLHAIHWLVLERADRVQRLPDAVQRIDSP